jgi:hypothetical protein
MATDTSIETARALGGRLINAKREQTPTGAWVDVLTYDTGCVAVNSADHYLQVYPSREAWIRGDRPALTFDLC